MLTLAPSSTAAQIEVDWARLPALAKLTFDGVEPIDATFDSFAALQQLSSLEIYSWGDDEEQEECTRARQSAIARLLRASPAALRSLELEVPASSDLGVGTVSQYQPDLSAAIGGLTQLLKLRCDDLGAACQLGQLQELRVPEKIWSELSAVDLVRLQAMRGLTRLELHSVQPWEPLSVALESGGVQVRRK